MKRSKCQKNKHGLPILGERQPKPTEYVFVDSFHPKRGMSSARYVCVQKVRYADLDSAIQKSNHFGQHVYECGICGGFHLTSKAK
jgi:hypothetical protein